MPSVTNVVNRITQPRLGFLPIRKFSINSYSDGNQIETNIPSYSSYAHIQGMAVDYLTRFLIGFSKRDAFKTPLMGAKKVKELSKANELLNKIKGLDKESIICTCKLVGYDVAIRRGVSYFSNVDTIKPDAAIINNIKIMVTRGIKFLKDHGELVSVGFTFEGGYTSLIESGDGDYLSTNEMWDFKTSLKKPDSKDSLQLIVYYILGYHSYNNIFKNLSTIGFFNPLRNESYQINVSEISDDVLRKVSNVVVGYKVKELPSRWFEIEGEDEELISRFKYRCLKDLVGNAFDPDDYDDGIFDITTDDYWTYIKDKYPSSRPKFPYTEKVKFLKHNGFIMFISVSKKGRLSILNGGKLKHLDRDIKYYYDNLPLYGEKVLQIFSKYWDRLYEIRNFILQLKPNKKGVKLLSKDTKETTMIGSGFNKGRVHGCIVDIDFFNHIYLNPFDGKVTPYHARSMYQKYIYKNLEDLIENHRPDLLQDYKKVLTNNSNLLLQVSGKNNITGPLSIESNKYSQIIYETDMYSVSNRIRSLQHVYDYNLVAAWYDRFLMQKKVIEAQPVINLEPGVYYEKLVESAFDIIKDEKEKTSKEHRFLIWETNSKITEKVLFKGIEQFINEVQKENKGSEIISIQCRWICPSNYNHSDTKVHCSMKDALSSIFAVLNKKDEYPEKLLLKYEDYDIIKKGRVKKISVVFYGGRQNTVLSVCGNYNYKEGRLIEI